MNLDKLIKFKIGEKVKIKKTCQHDKGYIGQIGEIAEYIILDHLEYYVQFKNTKCRFSLEELERLSEEELRYDSLLNGLNQVLTNITMIETEPGTCNSKYKLEAIDKLNKTIKSLSIFIVC